MLDGVALEWAETARDLLRAAAAEKESFAVAQAAEEARTKTERGRTLLEETQARCGRLLAHLAQLQADAAEATKRARSAEAERLREAQTGANLEGKAVKSRERTGQTGTR